MSPCYLITHVRFSPQHWYESFGLPLLLHHHMRFPYHCITVWDFPTTVLLHYCVTAWDFPTTALLHHHVRFPYHCITALLHEISLPPHYHVRFPYHCITTSHEIFPTLLWIIWLAPATILPCHRVKFPYHHITALLHHHMRSSPLHWKESDFFPTTSLKRSHGARIDELADSNEKAIISQSVDIRSCIQICFPYGLEFNCTVRYTLNITRYYGKLRLLTRGQLADPSFNSIHQNHNDLSDNGVHSLMIMRQMPTKSGNAPMASDSSYFEASNSLLWNCTQNFQMPQIGSPMSHQST